MEQYIRDLINSLIASMGPEWKPHFITHLEPLELSSERVIPLGLIVTELVININKYAYEGAPGPIAISLSGFPGHFRLKVADKGKRIDERTPGFGTRMMDVLVKQLGGILSFSDNAPGLCAELTVSSSATDLRAAVR